MGTIATSTVPAFKAALLTQLQARAGLSGVQVAWSNPTGEPSPDLIVLGDVRHNEISRTTGQSRREDYTMDVIVSCIANGTDAQTLTTHAYTLAAEVENQLRTDPKVNNTVQWAVVSGMDLAEPNTQLQMESRITMRVSCTALI